jgi:serine/threonine protein kinase
MLEKEDISSESKSSLPQWIGHPRPLKSYAEFKPFPAHEFRKIQKLANAIHGKIYLYEYLPTGKQVVVKKMSTCNVISFTPGLLEDALTEIGVTKYISSITQADYVIKMMGLYQDEEYTYFVTEYSSGGELFEHVVQAKSLADPLARKYTTEVLLAVKSLHHNGIVHRDVSLENTLLHADGSIRVIDFGQSVHLFNPRGPRSDTPLRHTGKAGKAYYRAPEMYNGEYDGAPVDAFAVGVMLFIMTVGTPPWNSAVPTDARYKYIEKHGVTKLLISWGKAQTMSPSLLDLIERLMCPDPKLRMTIDEALQHPWITGGDQQSIAPTVAVGIACE